MDEKYNNIVKEAEVLFDSILKDSKVLSILHSTMITISSTKAAKIIENQNGMSFINTIG